MVLGERVVLLTKDGEIEGTLAGWFERVSDNGEKVMYVNVKDKNGYHVYPESRVK